MDCIEAIALKPSLRRENSMKSSTQQAFFDDVFWCSTGVSGVPGEDFPIDDLLDFSNEDFTGEEEEEKGRENDDASNSAIFSVTGDFGFVPSDELPVPVDDLENLEWLSRFVDDSVSEFPVQNAAGKEKTGSYAENRSKPGSKQALPMRPLCFPSFIPAKPRTKRSRPAGRVWSLESPSLSESSSSPSHSGSSSPTSCLIFTNRVQTMDMFYSFGKPPVKKQKGKPAATSGETGGVQFQRRCSHCLVNKTPQWRTGPLGAKTLCNACGVRFKSGRLYPEYRPACSPTFSGDVHSNSHRKVLEMRRKKEMDEPESRLAEMVSSC